MMKQNALWTALGVAATFATTLLPTSPVFAASHQKNKNTWRNIGIGSAAVGLYGLTHHNGTATTLGTLGAAYSANRYEQERHKQSQAQRYHRYHRYHRR